MLGHEESLTTVVDNGNALRIHRPNGYKLSPVKVMKNIGTPSTSLDTEQMDVRNTEINTSLSDLSTASGVEGSETGPYMEQCHPETEQAREVTYHTEREISYDGGSI